VSQEDCVEGKRDHEDEEAEDEIGKLPSLDIDQILEEWDKEEGTESDPYPSEAIGCTSPSFKPVAENNRERSNAEASDTYSSDHSGKEIELEKRLNPCTEKESKRHQ